jgi:hypothetical protein
MTTNIEDLEHLLDLRQAYVSAALAEVQAVANLIEANDPETALLRGQAASLHGQDAQAKFEAFRTEAIRLRDGFDPMSTLAIPDTMPDAD